MKMILSTLAMVVPGVVRACGHGAAMGDGMMRHGGHLPAVLLAGVSALGYWVLFQSSKDSGYSRRAGQVVGWVLLVVGLAGFLCGAASHARKMGGAMRQCRATGEHASGAMQMPPGHPQIGGKLK
ncbi:MAG: hypothetical protein AAB262_04845 [Elusimicrobiota bacterium]